MKKRIVIHLFLIFAFVVGPVVIIAKAAFNPECSSSFWDRLDDTDELTAVQLMQYFTWGNTSSCELVHDFGGKMKEKPPGLDGQKAICLDPKVAPRPDECLVYSFGIADDEWSFEEVMEDYGCDVFAFDPTMMENKPNRNQSQHDIHFYRWGIGTREDDRKQKPRFGESYFSLSTIYEKLSERHGNKTIDYLKMDIESDEWSVVPDIVSSGMLSHVRQMGIRIHLPDADPIETYRNLAAILRSLETSGMVRFDSKRNPWFVGYFSKVHFLGSRGYEIAWYNRHLFHTSGMA